MLAFAFLAKFNSGKRGFQFKHKFEMYLVSVVEMPATDRLQFLQILLTASIVCLLEIQDALDSRAAQWLPHEHDVTGSNPAVIQSSFESEPACYGLKIKTK